MLLNRSLHDDDGVGVEDVGEEGEEDNNDDDDDELDVDGSFAIATARHRPTISRASSGRRSKATDNKYKKKGPLVNIVTPAEARNIEGNFANGEDMRWK